MAGPNNDTSIHRMELGTDLVITPTHVTDHVTDSALIKTMVQPAPGPPRQATTQFVIGMVMRGLRGHQQRVLIA